MPLYYFKLVDSIIVADHGVHELVDDDAARVEAIKWLAHFARHALN